MSLLTRRGSDAVAVVRSVVTCNAKTSCKFSSSLVSPKSKYSEQRSSKNESSIRSFVSVRQILTVNNEFANHKSLKSVNFMPNSYRNRLFYTGTCHQCFQNVSEAHLNDSNTISKESIEPHSDQPSINKKADRPYQAVLSNLNTKAKDDSGVARALHSLNLNVQRTGRAYMDHVLAIFNSIKVSGGCTSNEALLLLRCCGSFLTDEKRNVRADLSETLWSYFNSTNVELDTSHYNALLKNRLDNEGPEFQPSEFLAMMEENGIDANRVTFQHLIAKFCSTGDIQGATTILEYMKEQKMSVTENVFHSLIVGHCRADDFENAKGVLTIMKDSGVDVGPDSRMIYALELARAGKEYKKELDKGTAEGVKWTDHDFFKLILQLLEKKDPDAAAEIAAMLPRKRGFFQEMRNFIPAMISTGELELPFKILEGFRGPAEMGSEGHADSNVADHGIFFLNAMVRNEYDPKSVVQYAKKFQGAEAVVSHRILECCVERGNIAYGQSVYDEIVHEFGNNILDGALMQNFIRARMSVLVKQSIDKSSLVDNTMQFLADMGAIGLRPLVSDLSNNIIPPIMQEEGESPLPGQVIKNFSEKIDHMKRSGIEFRNPVPWYQLSNSMVQYLLNRENAISFASTVNFMLRQKLPHRPHLWNSSLARSFLATDSKETLVSVLGLSSSKFSKFSINNYAYSEENAIKNDEDLFLTLNHIAALIPRYRPNSTAEETLLPVLKDLVECQIGVPEKVSSMLKKNSQDSTGEFIEILGKLELIYKDDQNTLSEEQIRQFMESRGKLANLLVSTNLSNYVPMSPVGYIESDKVPTDLKGLLRIQKVLDQKKRFNSLVTSKLISAYSKNDQLDMAFERINSVVQSDKVFKIHNTALADYVKACIRREQYEKALSFFILLDENSNSLAVAEKYFSMYVDFIVALAKKGQHEKVIKLIQSIDIEKTQSRNGHENDAKAILACYASLGEDRIAQKIVQALKDKGIENIKYRAWTKRSQSTLTTSSPFIHDADIEEEIRNFEKIAKEEQRLVQPLALLKNIILNEGNEDVDGEGNTEFVDKRVERMQRVVDASVEVIGEAKSLYNLAFTFVDTGKLPQAKKLLATPGLRYDHSKIKWMMGKWAENKKVDELESFVLLTRPIFACDREFMYRFLISACEENKEYEKIGDAWVNMQEEDFGPSESIKQKIAHALNAGGLEVPFAVPGVNQKAIKQETPQDNVTDNISEIDQKKSSKQEIAQSDKITKSKKVKAAEFLIDEDIERYLKSLEATEGTEFLPNCKQFERVVLSSKNNADRLFDVAFKRAELEPKFVIETIKACLFAGHHSDIVGKLWESVKEKELPRKVFLESTLHYCNNEKLLPVKAFYLSCLENQSLNENNIENVKIQLTTIFNNMLRNAATVEAAVGEPKDMVVTPQDIVQEALSKWMLLEK